MKISINKLGAFLLAGVIFCGCTKTDGFGPLTDSEAAIPVTLVNVFNYLPNPTVKASKAENKITITLQVPAASGRTIKEVTKVSATALGNYGVIRDSTIVKSSGLYSNTPVAVNSTTYTFTTTMDEYKTKTNTTAALASNALLLRDFYFQLKLDNDQVVIPYSIRVWIVD
jgi:hypothetical protein